MQDETITKDEDLSIYKELFDKEINNENGLFFDHEIKVPEKQLRFVFMASILKAYHHKTYFAELEDKYLKFALDELNENLSINHFRYTGFHNAIAYYPLLKIADIVKQQSKLSEDLNTDLSSYQIVNAGGVRARLINDSLYNIKYISIIDSQDIVRMNNLGKSSPLLIEIKNATIAIAPRVEG